MPCLCDVCTGSGQPHPAGHRSDVVTVTIPVASWYPRVAVRPECATVTCSFFTKEPRSTCGSMPKIDVSDR
jgi:hypothetical protein